MSSHADFATAAEAIMPTLTKLDQLGLSPTLEPVRAAFVMTLIRLYEDGRRAGLREAVDGIRAGEALAVRVPHHG